MENPLVQLFASQLKRAVQLRDCTLPELERKLLDATIVSRTRDLGDLGEIELAHKIFLET